MMRWRAPQDMGNWFDLMNKYANAMEEMTPGEGRGRLEKASWFPPVDAWESENDFHLVFDIPGVEKESIDIQVDGDQLIIKGEKKTDDSFKYMRKERVFGPFYRAFTLETPIEREKIKAIYKNGVLEVVLPKKEEIKPKQIQIEVGDE
ncbi:MAG: Hsp20/alpha crystallin family protein [Firmicutes bacterium]|nr:Hsp20/alpha crystallin family protein [Bacillota bacterium]